MDVCLNDMPSRGRTEGERMRRLFEIFIVLIFCGASYVSHRPVESLTVYGLVGLSFSLALELANMSGWTKWRQALLCLGFALLTAAAEPFIFFLPLVLYAAFSGLGLPALALGILWPLTGNWMGFLPAGLAVYLSYRSGQFRAFTRQNLALSDQLKEDMISLEKYNARLLENESKSREIARLEERNRIARQLHDALGHTISSSILQIEALKLTEAEPAKKERLQLLQDTLANGMTDIRGQLRGMYDTVFSLERSLDELAAAAPAEMTVHVENQIQSNLSFDKKKDIFSIIREALTNTMKHSDAGSFTEFLKEQGGNQILLLYDDGGQEPDQMTLGMGLTGMEEIVQKYGGKMNYYYKNGFYIHIVLPPERV